MTTKPTLRKRLSAGAVLVLMTAGLLLAPAAASARDILVFAAASLKNALDDAAAAYKRETGTGVTVSYAASSALAKQIEAGAPADIFVSADLDWMDYLDGKGLIAKGTRHNLLGNTLVLIAPKDSTIATRIEPGFPLSRLLDGGKLAMCDTAAVPAGKYGKAALEYLGVWPSVAGAVAAAPNVRAALLLVARREAPLGIVYTTDAAAEPAVRIVGTFPEATHPPIIYPIGLVAPTPSPEAAPFLAWLESAKARSFFEKQGFSMLP